MKISIYLAFLLCGFVYSKLFEPCELGRIILNQNQFHIDLTSLGNWLCLANATSGYNSSMVGQFKPSSTSFQYGIFQLSNYWYCKDGFEDRNDDCGLECSELVDDDVLDDLLCAKLPYRRGGNTFQHWYHVEGVEEYCENNGEENRRFYEGCNFSNGSKPQILNAKTNFTFNLDETSQGDDILDCTANGTLPITIKWLKNKKALKPDDPNFGITSGFDAGSNNISSRVILLSTTFADNEYFTLFTCDAMNKYGKDSKDFLMKFNIGENLVTFPPETVPKETILLLVTVTISVSAFILTVIVIGVHKYLMGKNVGLSSKEVEAFYQGDINKILVGDSWESFDDTIHSEPYDKKWEISIKDLQLDKKSPLGCGQSGIVYKGMYGGKEVAVKTLKPRCEKVYLRTLLSELKLMIFIRGHKNIVSLTGAYTSGLSRGTLLLLLEFCPMGSLFKHLQNYRQNNNNLEDVRSINEVLMLTWAHQVASGMEYLSSIKVIHGDLATRNILLLNLNTVKITDFGLSRKLYDYVTYIKMEDEKEPLPWRWLSPETLRDLTFSTFSDVWSFGIAVWEIFSLAQVPYPGIGWSGEFVKQLETGLRLSKPEKASNSIFQLMSECWEHLPQDRPSFRTIRQRIYLQVMKFSSQDYIQLFEDDIDEARALAYRTIEILPQP